jgi:hypothetical protein
MQRPETLDQLRIVHQSMNRHLLNPDSWDPVNTDDLQKLKCVCIFTMGTWKLAPATWQLLQAWLAPLKEFGIAYDVCGKERGRLHFTLHQCSFFSKGPFTQYDGAFLKDLLNDLNGLHIVFRGLLVTPTGIALRGEPSTEHELKKLMSVRNRLGMAFEKAGVPFNPPYINDICHTTLFRWTHKPSQAAIDYIQTELSKWDYSVLAEITPYTWHFGYGSLTMNESEIDYLSSFWTPLRIAHRGLVDGPNHSIENSIQTLQERKEAGLHSEIDIWWKDQQFWIGHDEPREPVSLEFLTSPYFWIHAKHSASFRELQRVSHERGLGLRIFYHTDEDYALTTLGDTIICPGVQDCSGWVYMMPEMCSVTPTESGAICSDFC